MERFFPPASPFKPIGAAPAPSITLQGTQNFTTPVGKATTTIVYTADKRVLTPENFTQWLKDAATKKWDTWEALATALIDGFYDTLLPEKVILTLAITHADGTQQCIELEQHQP